ncbi:uncharacterized protein A4U43_C04F33930 [Asparagus officinalis]|uniref:Uncharacterized protein n=1 Tax=Asparagus officinalis TaxID=4686 RepID=A0A5P1FA67_ASPOF|nr:uncharacterized protein A4U43_C04F33930 [Asparagus officinalis]
MEPGELDSGQQGQRRRARSSDSSSAGAATANPERAATAISELRFGAQRDGDGDSRKEASGRSARRLSGRRRPIPGRRTVLATACGAAGGLESEREAQRGGG